MAKKSSLSIGNVSLVLAGGMALYLYLWGRKLGSA